MIILEGTRLGHYEIRSQIGVGGMGEVYLALDTELLRPVALKFLQKDVASDQKRMNRFIQEARAASALNHPNILTVYEIGQMEGTRFFATEFVEGITLRERMKSPMKLDEVLDISIQVARALVAAHAAGIIHRDIKPENIMLRRDALVKVLDFGLAKLVEPQAAALDSQAPTKALVNTEAGTVMGTVAYMSPEQARGHEVDARSDLWSLGCVLYEMVAKRQPFAGETLSDVLAALLKTTPVPLKQIAPTIPDELQRIASKALRHEKDERYQTAQDLLIDLRYLQKQLESESENERSAATIQDIPSDKAVHSVTKQTAAANALSATAGASTSLLVQFKSHKSVVIVVLAALVAVGAAITAYLFRQPDAQPERQPSQRILSRLTFDAGLQSEPTWSPDGRFIAYSSDQSGNFDIWVKPVGEGNPVQVTKSAAHDWQPDWSADGKLIVFRSERDGGGLFVTPAPTGGNERKISSFGYHPRWSPDGSQILFYSTNLRNNPAPPKLYVVGLDGAPPREVLSEALSGMSGRLSAAWHPDGKRISLWSEQRGAEMTFVTIPLAGGAPVKSEIKAEIVGQVKAAGVDLFDFRWSPSGQALYFEGISRGVRNLWKILVEPQSLRWVVRPERLTTGPGPDTDLALSPDGSKLAFTTRTEQTRLWSLPFNAATGQVKGTGQPVTPAGIDTFSFDVSRDGKRLAFITERAGKRELREKSFADGSEKLLAAADGFSRAAPRWSRDGQRLVYVRSRLVSQERTQYEHTLEHALVLLDLRNGNEQMLTSHHQLQGWSWDWTADEQFILGSSSRSSPGQWGLYLYPLAAAPNAETQMRLISVKPGYNAFNARFSPDENWICFIGNKTDDAGVGTIFVVPTAGGEWVRVTESSDFNDKPRWSPDGRTIYFISNRSGFFNVWGRRFDPASGHSTGEMFRVTNFENPGRMIPSRVVPMELQITAERLVVPIMEVSGSIWILENVGR